ncbi:eukaryotic translation initiation factor 3 subunit G-1-like isoform X2 [Uloborus diversus]|uniref:eukaryotic translation initiation factor 3 subunit G-1-like isoform X2 n=1 Tax=Uloborus diversus TaxID=327109 RepID=UPI002409E841|nr:eukaryotic translation initiation factor 3 subunit G-1-like isoform X2 [Uloborus diversus]
MEKRISLDYSVAVEKSRSNNSYCSVPQCNSHGGSPELSFHRFPSVELKRKQWQTALRIGREISNYMRACSLHFKSNDYLPYPPVRGRIRRRLKLGVVPSLNLPKDNFKGYPTTRRKLKQNAIPSLNLPSTVIKNHESPIQCEKEIDFKQFIKKERNSTDESDSESPLHPVKTEAEIAPACIICKGKHLADQCSLVNTESTEAPTSVTKNSRTTIRISNLPAETYHSDLHKLFGSFGKVDKIYIVKTSLSGKCSGLAFIHYLDHEEASRAFLLDGHTFGTNILKIEWAKGGSDG